MNLSNLISNYEEAVAMILFVIGLSNLLLQSNLMKKIIGLNIMDTAVYLFLALKGYIEGRSAPIVTDGVTDVDAYINPIPSGLVLTGIVVSVSVSALMLSLTIRLYRRYHTLNLDEISMIIRERESETIDHHDFPALEKTAATTEKTTETAATTEKTTETAATTEKTAETAATAEMTTETVAADGKTAETAGQTEGGK